MGSPPLRMVAPPPLLTRPGGVREPVPCPGWGVGAVIDVHVTDSGESYLELAVTPAPGDPPVLLNRLPVPREQLRALGAALLRAASTAEGDAA